MAVNKDILNDLRDGNLTAFNVVFKAYYNNVKHYIRDLVKSTDEAEELAQEVFIKLWEVKERVDPERNFKSFLFTIAHNMSLKYIKGKLRDEAFLAELATHNEEGAATDDEYLARELFLKVESVVEELSEQKKKIYRMSVDEELTIKEIAEKLELNPRTVSNTLRLAANEVKEKVSKVL